MPRIEPRREPGSFRHASEWTRAGRAVYGWCGCAEQPCRGPVSTNSPAYITATSVGDARDHAQVVRDEDQRHAELALQLREQAQDLRLDRHVERRGRLVGDQQLRIVHERHRDHHALALAAGELMRILAEAARRAGDAHAFEQPHGAIGRLGQRCTRGAAAWSPRAGRPMV